MITFHKLSVDSPSAITANLGAVYSGEIHGATIYSGPSNGIVIDANGISIPDGTSVSGYGISMGASDHEPVWSVVRACQPGQR